MPGSTLIGRSGESHQIIHLNTKNMSEQNQAGSNPVPPSATFELVLNKVIEGQSPFNDANCQYTYQWDFGTNTGEARLLSINGDRVKIILHPLGIEGYLDFMSDQPPTTYTVNGQEVVISRVILDIDLSNNARSAALMFGDGSILGTANFTEAKLAIMS
jgi:hypothetical protein